MKNKNKQTKFPVARIKKIMQKDDDVGKVAQATPIVISKALEMFLALIVEKAGEVTLDRGSRKVEAYHLKHAVETIDTFDFLREIVESVPDPSAGGTIDLDALSADNASKKKRSKGKKAAAAANGNGENVAPAPKKRKKKVKSEEVAEDANEGGEDAVMADSGEAEANEEEEGEEKAPQMTDEDEDEEDQWRNDKPYRPSR
ncbi:histone-fold-containing protein [Lentinula aff. detonsa]|uniref:Histone-fold-containing protein n=1 Tax=Lentinula aff. detonsa TaxID=2804958 RepID=A0AA38KE06_9AGAR|nr:histone-fold-containing protein [Lentinula aff. detonsa]KAJ3792530.1 histone-fold-containing protein [Lentinula aff. detonsa]